VVRRLRNFIWLGRSETAPITVPRLVHEAVAYCHAELDTQGIELQSRLARDLPAVKADALEIEHAIVNLVRNAAEALRDEAALESLRLLLEGRGLRACAASSRPRHSWRS
jgi:C4-dicarboxylate-specific signal transduction histidine kinase